MTDEYPPFAPEICKPYEKIYLNPDKKSAKTRYCIRSNCRYFCDGKCCYPAESLSGWLDHKHGIIREKEPLTFFVTIKKHDNESLYVRQEKIKFNNEKECIEIYEKIVKIIKEYQKE